MDKATRLGVLAGGFTALSGLVGYFVVPLVTGATDRSLDSIMLVGVETVNQSPATYHVAVLIVPSFLATVAAVLQARRWGLATRVTDWKLLGGTFLTPVGAAIATYLLGAAMVTAVFAVPVALEGLKQGFPAIGTPIGFLLAVLALLGFLLFVVVVMMMALFIGGAMFVSRALPVVLLAVGAGTLGGYLVARSVTYVQQYAPESD